MPLFFLAWPAARLLDNFLLALPRSWVFMWPSDGQEIALVLRRKIAVGLAGIAPFALFAGVAVQVLVFAACRLRAKGRRVYQGLQGTTLGRHHGFDLRRAVDHLRVEDVQFSEAYIREGRNSGRPTGRSA